MTISALIPTYKSSSTIIESLESILAQKRPADEIIVLLDGQGDDTLEKLQPYIHRITIVVQENKGIAQTRNRLAQMAYGEILAFLDADDIWHPDYLEQQHGLFTRFPNAVAGFTGHTRFREAEFHWSPEVMERHNPELISPEAFFVRYNITTAVFGSMSYMCIRKLSLEKVGPDPFSTDLNAVEDSYVCYQLTLVGPVAFMPTRLVGYRLNEGSLSQDRLRNLGRWALAFERLEYKYKSCGSHRLMTVFAKYYASKRRELAKTLMGAGRTKEARNELRKSMRNCSQPLSLARSMTLLALTGLPGLLQPKWPSSVRVFD